MGGGGLPVAFYAQRYGVSPKNAHDRKSEDHFRITEVNIDTRFDNLAFLKEHIL
jgi:hypothetical protein